MSAETSGNVRVAPSPTRANQVASRLKNPFGASPGVTYKVANDGKAAGGAQSARTQMQQLKGKKIKFKKVSPAQLRRLLYRLIVLAAAVHSIAISFDAVHESRSLLRELVGDFVSKGRVVSRALEKQIGTTTLRESPLVTRLLQHDTRPRNATIYVDASGASFDRCATMSATAQAIYSPTNLRTLYAALARDTAYNLTFVASNASELIAPVVVCDLDIVASGFEALGVFHFLVRKLADPNDVYMLTVNFANQIYKINLQKEVGPAGVGTLTFVNDLRASDVKCHYIVSLGYPYAVLDFRVYTLTGLTDRGSWIFKRIRNGDPTDLAKIVRVSTRSGFYIDSDTSQANIFTERWVVSSNAMEAVAGPEWLSKPYMYDQWAWVHFVQLYFGVSSLLSLVVLVLITYRNFVSGKLWIGDAFVAASGSNTLRGLLVLLSWYFGGFWSLLEFCIATANDVFKVTDMAIDSSIIYADLLTLYFSLCGVLGLIFRERIDPLLTMLSFHIGFTYRVSILRWFPAASQTVSTFSSAFYNSGMLPAIDGQSEVSPMRFWTPHSVFPVPTDVIVATLAPVFGMLASVVLFIVLKKVYRRFYPDPLHIQRSSNTTAMSEDEATMRQRLSVLTIFEIATGAHLANRFGVLAEYDNCLFIKGMKFATPDGIYSSGFVIVNQKYLLQADDLWTVLVMKVLRHRFANIYMYEIKGSTVEQRARLVYPDTFKLTELVCLNTSVLS